MKTELKKIESYLPLFPGFYNTQFECDCEDDYIEDGKTYDDYEWNYKDYHERIANACTDAVAEQLKDLGIETKFQAIISPKYYNYSNDSINVEYTLKEDTIKKLLTYIIDDIDEFNGWVEYNYTNYDGFMSFYSNKGIDWIADYIMNEDKMAHVFGALLGYYLESNEYGVEDLLESLYEDGETHQIECELIEVSE